MHRTSMVADTPAALRDFFDIARQQRDLRITARNIEHIVRQRHAGQPCAQCPHQFLAPGDRHTEMRGTWRKIRMMQIIRLDTVLHESPHQRVECFDIVVHAFQEHRLTDQRNAGINQPCDGSAGIS